MSTYLSSLNKMVFISSLPEPNTASLRKRAVAAIIKPAPTMKRTACAFEKVFFRRITANKALHIIAPAVPTKTAVKTMPTELKNFKPCTLEIAYILRKHTLIPDRYLLRSHTVARLEESWFRLALCGTIGILEKVGCVSDCRMPERSPFYCVCKNRYGSQSLEQRLYEVLKKFIRQSNTQSKAYVTLAR